MPSLRNNLFHWPRVELNQTQLKRWLCKEWDLPSPVELEIGNSMPIRIQQLSRKHFHRPPSQAKITNNGKTVVLSGKWTDTRPYICGGPFTGKYVFSTFHLHWAERDDRGSEHSSDGQRFPLEMHVVYFKANYALYEEAVKYDDGVIFEVHFFYIQVDDNPSLASLVENLPYVHKSGTSVAVDKLSLSRYFTPFTTDYFLYAGKMMSDTCGHKVMWIICRHLSGISHIQMTGFRSLLDKDDLPLLRNFHRIYKIGKRKIYHINPSEYVGKILYPFTKNPLNKTERLCIRFKFKPSNGDKKNIVNDHKVKLRRKVSHMKKEKLHSYKLPNRPQYSASIEEIQNIKTDTGTNSLDKKKSIFDYVLEWIRNSMVYNKEGISSSCETEADRRKDGCSTKKGDSVIFKKTTKLNNSTAKPGKLKNSSTLPKKMINKGVQVAGEFNSTKVQKFHINKLTNLQTVQCKRPHDIYKDSNQFLIQSKTKFSVLSHLGSNFSIDALNNKKSAKNIQLNTKDGIMIPSNITNSKNNKKSMSRKSVMNKNPGSQKKSPETDINCTKSDTGRERNGKTITKTNNIKNPTAYNNETKKDKVRSVRDDHLKDENMHSRGASKQNPPVQNYQDEASSNNKKLFNTFKERTPGEKSENNQKNVIAKDKINYLENSDVYKDATDSFKKRTERRKITVPYTSQCEYTNELNLQKQKPDKTARRSPNDNFEYRLIKSNNGFGDVKVNNTPSHESLHIYINKPIGKSNIITDGKTKKGTIFDWLQLAKEKIIA